MTKLALQFILAVLLLWGNSAKAQDVFYSLPESCIDAPFFCNDYLINLTSNNVNGAPNNLMGLTGCTMENSVWLSFTTCSDNIELNFSVDSCGLGNGLEFSLFSTADCIDYTLVGNPCNVIVDGTSNGINFNGLTNGATYHLAIDGINGDECRFRVESLSGVYTAPIVDPNSSYGYVYTIETPAELECVPNPIGCGGLYKLIPAICSADICVDPFNGGGSMGDSCAIQFDICRSDSGTIIFSPQLYDTIVQWNIPDCAIVTGDTTGYELDINFDQCLIDYVNNTVPFPPQPFTGNPADVFNFDVSATEILVPINTPEPIDTITDQGVDIFCNCPPLVTAIDCNNCLSDASDSKPTPIDYHEELYEVCPGECANTSVGTLCPGESEITFDGCLIVTRIIVEEFDPQNLDFGTIVLCEWDCFEYQGNTVCGEGFHSFSLLDDNGCEITATVNIIHEYSPSIIPPTGAGLITCDNPCVSLDAFAINATFTYWDGPGGVQNGNSAIACTAGTYTFFAENQCGIESGTIVVDEDTQAPDLSLSATTLVLNATNPTSTITANTTNGPSITFDWADDQGPLFQSTAEITVSNPGTYFATVTNGDNGCTTTASIDITQDSTPIVLLTRLGDSCQVAPLFCAEFLDGLHTNNENGSTDSLNIEVGCQIENGVWLKFMACEEFAELSFIVDSCSQAQGLEFSLLSTAECDSFSVVENCQTVSNGSAQNLIFDSLEIGGMYYLFIDGIDGDICSVDVGVISGVVNSAYTDSLDQSDTIQYILEQLTDGIISGPSEICAFAPTTYTFIPGTCDIVEGDCNRAMSTSDGDARADLCDLPFNLCFENTLGLDTIVDWDIPDGIDIIGDSTDFDITIEAGLDFILEYYNGMIPTSDTDTIVVTLYADYSIVPITDTIAGDTTGLVYCYCPSSGIICGSCTTGASLDVDIIIIFNSETIFTCDPDCIDLCDQQLCPGGSVYCTEPCVLTTWSLIEEPITIDTYFETVCPGECAQTPYGEYCPGSYTIQLTDCDYVNINIDEATENDIVFPDELICPGDCVNVGSMTFCAPGFETWSENIGGCITNYSVTIIQSNTTPIDYGTIVLCEGDCLDIGTNSFCTPGVHNFLDVNADGCQIDATVNLEFEIADLFVNQAIEICEPLNDSYTVTFFISGDAPFLVNGFEISGNTFTSLPIPTGQPYSFEVKNSVTPCPQTIYVDGLYYCPLLNCDSDPGLLEMERQDLCIIDPVVISEISPVYLENTDMTSEFILHTATDPLNGNILMRNSTGNFNYDPNILSLQTEYYTSRIVGEKIGNQVDLNSSCYKFTEGPLVEFYSEIEVTVTPSSQLEISCLIDEINIQTIVVGGSGQFNYNWTGNVNSANDPDVIITDSGNYTINVVDQLTGCNNSFSINISENLVEPAFQLSTPVEMLNCEVSEVEIEINSNNVVNNPSYQWIGPSGQLPLSGTPQSILVDVPGWYYLTIMDEQNGCSSIDSTEVLINENLPEALVLDIQQPVCFNFSLGALAVIDVEGGTPPFDYSIDGFSTTSEIQNLAPGSYELEISDFYGCKIIETIVIDEPIELTSDLESEIQIEFGQQITLDPALNFVPFSTFWTDEEGAVISTDEIINISPSEDLRLTFSASTEEGCIIETEIKILLKAIEGGLYIPSAFSPNGDEINDFFEIFGNDKISNIDELYIFDRWGSLVFQAKDYLPQSEVGKWDGTFNGKLLNAGVFVYKVGYTLIDGQQKIDTGDILLIN